MCRRGLRLVFLNACETGRGGRVDWNRGVAPALVAAGLPAVVANQYAVARRRGDRLRRASSTPSSRGGTRARRRRARGARGGGPRARDRPARLGGARRLRPRPARAAAVRRALLGPVLLALALRLAAVLATRPRRRPTSSATSRSAATCSTSRWNPYETKRLYPYPPPWAAVEAAAEWLARRGVAALRGRTSSCPCSPPTSLIVALLAAAARARPRLAARAVALRRSTP